MPDNLKWCSRHDSGNGAWLPRELFRAYPSACHECRKQYDRKMRRGKQTLSQAYWTCRNGALQRGLVWEISIDWFNHLAIQPCSYGSGVRPVIRVSLDRKDSTQGYTMDNCVPCCARHNEMKRHWFTFDEMHKITNIIPSARACGNTKSGRKDTHRPASVNTSRNFLLRD